MFKLAFIGGSKNSIAGYPHFIASQMDKRFQVVAGAFSTDEQINHETAKAWQVERVYDDWHTLIKAEKDNIDAVVVLVPTPLHAEIIIELLKLDIAIISEKTMVSSIEEVKQLEAYYNPQKHFLKITNNYSGYPMVRALKQKIKNKELGHILQIRIQMPQESF
jgi:predicted dehydrogenase